VTTQATTQKAQTISKWRRSLLLGLGVGAALAGAVALAGPAQQADAAAPEKIVFVSERTTGKGVNNPTGDAEIFRMNPNGTGLRQLTFNTAEEDFPVLSPDGTKIAYRSNGIQDSNPEGDYEIYVMNASDGSGNRNLTDNQYNVDDLPPKISPDGQKIVYSSAGEVYVMNASDGSGKTNLSENGPNVSDYSPRFSPDGQKVVYTSIGDSEYNPEGDEDIYVVNADGSNQKNLTNTDWPIKDRSPAFSPDGQKIVYTSSGAQTSNPEGDEEVYAMNLSDGSAKKNLTDNGPGVDEYQGVFSPDGQKILYWSQGAQATNPEGEAELYLMNATDGTAKKNLTNNAARDFHPEWGR
jgi:Tol biopolymer transport system component